MLLRASWKVKVESWPHGLITIVLQLAAGFSSGWTEKASMHFWVGIDNHLIKKSYCRATEAGSELRGKDSLSRQQECSGSSATQGLAGSQEPILIQIP